MAVPDREQAKAHLEGVAAAKLASHEDENYESGKHHACQRGDAVLTGEPLLSAEFMIE